MPDNSISTTIQSLNPFTVSTPNYAGVFTVNFSAGTGFKITDSSFPDNSIEFNSSGLLKFHSTNDITFDAPNIAIGPLSIGIGGTLTNLAVAGIGDTIISFGDGVTQNLDISMLGGLSIDGNVGFSGSVTTANLVGKTMIFHKGLLIGFA